MVARVTGLLGGEFQSQSVLLYSTVYSDSISGQVNGGYLIYVPDLRIPSLSIRHCRVVRFRPRSAAAPLRPLTSQFERCSALSMVRRSVSSRVSCFPTVGETG
jgi:hypothetical protein